MRLLLWVLCPLLATEAFEYRALACDICSTMSSMEASATEPTSLCGLE